MQNGPSEEKKMGVKKDEEMRGQEGKKAEATKVEEKKSEEKKSEEKNRVVFKQMEKSMSMSSTNSEYEPEINEGTASASDLEKSARRKSRLISGVSIR